MNANKKFTNSRAENIGLAIYSVTYSSLICVHSINMVANTVKISVKITLLQ